MEKQNVTLSLEKTLLKKAKMAAVQEDKSLTELVREILQKKVDVEDGYRRAMRNHCRMLEKGFPLGTNGKIPVTREELHGRR